MSQSWRVNLVFILFFLMGGALIARLFDLQFLNYEYYQVLAKNQHQILEKLLPQRGKILLQDLSNPNNYTPLALDKEFQQVYLVPRNISEDKKEELVKKLSEILGIDKEMIFKKANKKNDPYEPLKHKISDQKAKDIKNINIKGVGVLSETWRYYPYDALGSHVVGFVSRRKDNQRIGQYGLEKSLQKELSGEPGIIEGRKDTSGFYIPSLESKIKPAKDGDDLLLTIDQNIQFKAEKELKKVIEKYKAESGSIIVMNPKTGAIRAMANSPEFNPNEYNKVEEIGVFINPSVQKVYEPGSIFKPITMAIGLDTNSIKPETVYEDKGRIQVGGRVIKNVDGKVYGDQDMTQVLEKSLNTGAVFIQQSTKDNYFKSYIQKFGFGSLTGLELPGEVRGDIFNLFTGRKINLANISFGQGISVTPIGMINAVSAIANNGKMMQPYIIEKRIKSDGEEIITEPKMRKQVISKETANKVTKMMVSVVDSGFGKKAQVRGYSVAGKTGTAQVPDPKGKGYSEDTIHSFIGFAPAFNPRFIILVKLDKPQDVRFSSESVASVFHNLAEYILNYFEIPPA